MSSKKKGLRAKGVTSLEHLQGLEKIINKYNTRVYEVSNLYKFCDKNVNIVEEVYYIREALTGGSPALMTIAGLRMGFLSATAEAISQTIINVHNATAQKHLSVTVSMMVTIVESSLEGISTLEELYTMCIKSDLRKFSATDNVNTDCSYEEVYNFSEENEGGVEELDFG